MTKVHVFEKAGLGTAPFTFEGYYVDKGPRKTVLSNGITIESGSPGQPMGVCDYCGTSISNCFRVKSSDGKEFVVGSECVLKTGDDGLKAEINQVKAQVKREKDDLKISENWEWFLENKDSLKSIQYGRYSLDVSIEWYYKNAGRSGKLRIIRDAKKLLNSKS